MTMIQTVTLYFNTKRTQLQITIRKKLTYFYLFQLSYLYY